jgi:serine/threonine protein kinase
LSFDEKRKKHHYILKIVNTKNSNEFAPPSASREIEILEYLNDSYPELDKYHNKLLGYILYRDKNRAALLLSFVPGMTLEDWLKKQRSESDLTDMFNSIHSSIQKLHTANIIHRDLKPDNIWIPHNNQLPPRFMDFSHASKDGEVFTTKNGRKHQATRKNNTNALQRLRLRHKGGKTRRR